MALKCLTIWGLGRSNWLAPVLEKLAMSLRQKLGLAQKWSSTFVEFSLKIFCTIGFFCEQSNRKKSSLILIY